MASSDGEELTGALVFVFVGKDGFRWDERREGWRDDVHYPLVVRKPAGKRAKRRHQGDFFHMTGSKEKHETRLFPDLHFSYFSSFN